MDRDTRDPHQTQELIISFIVLVIVLMYTYALLIAVPYPGFLINPTTGKVDFVFIAGQSHIQTGDTIEQIGDMTMDQFKADRRLVLFDGVKKGDTIEIVIRRNGERTTVPWVMPGFNQNEFAIRLFNSWILAYVFWSAGFATQLSIRPRDLRRRLFISANFLIALFLVSGNLSFSHLWESSTVLHIVSWLMMPVFLHLHWVFPRPLRNISNSFWVFLYGLAGLLAAGEAFHFLGRNIYTLGFAIAIVGSFLLLFAHLPGQKNERPTIGLLLLSILFSFSFSIAVAVALAFGLALDLGWLTVFSMPFMPLAYFYLIYRRQLGGMETRVNRLISIYAFLILVAIGLFTISILLVRSQPSQETWFFMVIGLAVITSLLTAVFLPRFRAFVDQKIFGIKLPYQRLTETYSSRIASSVTLPGLLHLLEGEVFPSLLIRQYAFLQSDGKKLLPLLLKNSPGDLFDFDFLTQNAGHYIPNLPPNEDWVRLILPLKLGDNILGFWLLGKRDPDDLYPQAEIPILQSLADQTAIALSYSIQSERLRNFYQADIESIEHERTRISRDLHDDVLNQLAAMRNSLDQKTLPPSFLSAYDDLKKRLREIITDLRPPMLDQGLVFAIKELVDDLREKNGNVNITLDLRSGEERIPEKMEEHFFHIIHEACENALRHANPRTLSISGEILPKRVDLTIRDDGQGFDMNGELNSLIASHHFGLANMKERAHIIGANIDFYSEPQKGMNIRVLWSR